VQPDYNLRQVYVHAARTVVYLIELPQIPSETLRADFEELGNKLTHAIRADTKLEREAPGWPGLFTFNAYIFARRFSFGGMLWLPMLAIGLGACGRELVRFRRRPRASGPPLLAAMQLPLFLGVVLLIRWMGAGPDRFWISAYALSIPVTLWYVTRWTVRSGVVAGVACFVFAWTAFSAAQGVMLRLDYSLIHPIGAEDLDAPLHEIPPLLPQGSRILLVSGNSTRDYGLFDPQHGYCNTVVQWGNAPFDPVKLGELLKMDRINHVVIENDKAVQFYGVGELDTTPLIAWLDGHGFQSVPLQTPHVRLYQRLAAPSP
jgi:hypothetical protein